MTAGRLSLSSRPIGSLLFELRERVAVSTNRWMRTRFRMSVGRGYLALWRTAFEIVQSYCVSGGSPRPVLTLK